MSIVNKCTEARSPRLDAIGALQVTRGLLKWPRTVSAAMLDAVMRWIDESPTPTIISWEIAITCIACLHPVSTLYGYANRIAEVLMSCLGDTNPVPDFLVSSPYSTIVFPQARVKVALQTPFFELSEGELSCNTCVSRRTCMTIAALYALQLLIINVPLSCNIVKMLLRQLFHLLRHSSCCIRMPAVRCLGNLLRARDTFLVCTK